MDLWATLIVKSCNIIKSSVPMKISFYLSPLLTLTNLERPNFERETQKLSEYWYCKVHLIYKIRKTQSNVKIL